MSASSQQYGQNLSGTILFFGDSLTAGYGLDNISLESLPSLIQQKINAENMSMQVINAGVSGETSFDGLKRIDLYLDQHFDIFVLELGANDIFKDIPPHLTHQNLQAIIHKVKATFPKISMLLLGMEIPAWIAADKIAPYHYVFRTLAAENNMELIPFLLEGVAGLSHLNLSDGYHPSAEGYRIIANNIWPSLKQLILGHLQALNIKKS
ncbi:arylesterase [Pedobacter sp.]|uniref:arylesterase n=1 Tax=Pedobacter sp. TaxID=1411316 RepID=UPI003D7F3DEF